MLSAALLTARLLRRAPAFAVHRLWTGLFAIILALPLLSSTLPAFDISIPASWSPSISSGSSAGKGETVAGAVTRSMATIQTGTSAIEQIARDAKAVGDRASQTGARKAAGAAVLSRVSIALLAIWFIGAAAAVTAIFRSHVRVRRLARSAEELNTSEWRSAADAIGLRLGVNSPLRLLVNSGVSTPMAGGILRPAIFLPISARTWQSDHRDVVLAHEATHLSVRDPLRHLLKRLALAVYWFHPLAWMAARADDMACERACDDRVLALGIRPSTYARVLLDLVDSCRATLDLRGALPMVRRSDLERRLMAILSDGVRPNGNRLVMTAIVVLGALTVSVAAVTKPKYSRALIEKPAVALAARTVSLQPLTRTPAPTLKHPTSNTVSPAFTRIVASRDSPCLVQASDLLSFDGNLSGNGERSQVREQVGRRGDDRIVQKTFGDLQVCMLAEDAHSDSDRPSELPGRASRVVLETRRGTTVERQEVSLRGVARNVWQINDRDRALDAVAETWRNRVLALLDTTWEIAIVRREAASPSGLAVFGDRQTGLQDRMTRLQARRDADLSHLEEALRSIRRRDTS
jgi:beta-lactamase regulating signal transducer with metallopeptidase domain